MDVSHALKQNPLLSGFSDDGIKIIQSVCTTRTVPAGSPIFVDDMHGESAYLLVEGRVSLVRAGPHGERPLAALDAPEAFGELALIHQGPRRITVRAETTVTLIEITRRDFQSLQKQRPQACLKLLMNIVDRFAAKAGEAAPLMEHMIDAVTG